MCGASPIHKLKKKEVFELERNREGMHWWPKLWKGFSEETYWAPCIRWGETEEGYHNGAGGSVFYCSSDASWFSGRVNLEEITWLALRLWIGLENLLKCLSFRKACSWFIYLFWTVQRYFRCVKVIAMPWFLVCTTKHHYLGFRMWFQGQWIYLLQVWSFAHCDSGS